MPQNIADLRAEVLEVLLKIEQIARKNPHRRVSVRNRTRESITRQVHYTNTEEALTRLKEDAERILSCWSATSQTD